MQTGAPTGETADRRRWRASRRRTEATAPASTWSASAATGRRSTWTVGGSGAPGTTTTYDLEALTTHLTMNGSTHSVDPGDEVTHQRLGPRRHRPAPGARHDDPGGQARGRLQLPAGAGGRRRDDRPQRDRARPRSPRSTGGGSPTGRWPRQRVRGVPGRRDAADGASPTSRRRTDAQTPQAPSPRPRRTLDPADAPRAPRRRLDAPNETPTPRATEPSTTPTPTP